MSCQTHTPPKKNGPADIMVEYFNTSALIYLYNAFIFPYLMYSVEIWGNALSIHIQSLVKLQNKIVRIITSSYHTTEQLYNNTGILQFKILVTHRIGLLMSKLSHGNVPNQSKIYINQIITYTLTSHGMLIIFIQ